jgi:SNF2 family DNA or RNA helicase
MTTLDYFVSEPNQRVLVPYRDQVQALWPDAPTLGHNGDTYAILDHTPLELIKLRNVGVEVPAPIASYYNWLGGTPFKTQKITSALLTSNHRAYVLNDMGTGKTKAALWSWHYLRKCGCANKLLVVAPLSTLKFVWLAEVHRTLPGIKAVVLHHDVLAKRRRLLKDNRDAEIFIINHDGLKTLIRELHDFTAIDTLVLDELAVYRNQSIRSKQMREFAPRFKWTWGMTGRPMPQAPTDVWAQCKILTPHTVPQYFSHARSAIMIKVSDYLWVPKKDAIETAFSWMQPSVRFTLDDVVELPEAISRIVEVPLSLQQQQIYQQLANEMAVMVEEKIITAANAAVAMGKLLQIGAGYVYSDNPLAAELDSNPRKEALLEIVEEAEHKLIVFAPWRHLLEGLSRLLGGNKIDHAMVHGDTKDRNTIFNDFQNSVRYRVLLAHPQCVHHGLTLTAATTIVWYSPMPSLEVYEQANARIRRIGQRHKQQFLHLQATPVERKVYQMLRTKQKLQDKFLDLVVGASGPIAVS